MFLPVAFINKPFCFFILSRVGVGRISKGKSPYYIIRPIIDKTTVIPYNKGKSKTFCLHVQAGGFSKEFSLRLKSEKIHLKKTLRLRF